MGVTMDLPNNWLEQLQTECKKPYFVKLEQILRTQEEQHTIFPPREKRFRALELTSYETVKVVILGQDPYHGKGQANGLAFSVEDGVLIPKSLGNIYKELEEDLGIVVLKGGNLEQWAKQGVLLLNTSLTVREGEADSHKKIGWEHFTNAIIEKLNEKNTPIVFILWGGNARKKATMITAPHHLIIESAHPSPLSAYRGFFGSKPFSRTNEYLQEQGMIPIMWEFQEKH
ncbi:MAG: uracil-DNA glycosylase [Eubacteriales bacterium]